MNTDCFPSDLEQNLIANDILITKEKSGEDIIARYHKWKDIWGDNKLFQLSGQNSMIKIRALAVTLPMMLQTETDGGMQRYKGYVAGISHSVSQDGEVKIYPLNDIYWVN